MKNDRYYVFTPALYDIDWYDGNDFKEAVSSVDYAFNCGADVVVWWHNGNEIVLRN